MIDAVYEQLSNIEFYKLTFFALGAFGGMLFAYWARWSWDELDIGLCKYLVGDKHAVGRALTTLIILCVVTDGKNYLELMPIEDILFAGAGIGLLVPAAVESKKKQKLLEHTTLTEEVAAPKIIVKNIGRTK